MAAATTVWNPGDPVHYIELVTQATSVAAGAGVKNFFNVFHFRRTTTANPLSKAHIDTAFQAAIGAKMLLALSVAYTQTQDTIRYFEDATDAPVGFSLAGVGAIAAGRSADFTAVTIQLKTLAKGKLGRGSKHFGPIGETDYVGDVLTVGAQGRFATLGAAIVAGFTDADGNIWVPGIKRAPRPTKPEQYVTNPTTTTWTDISSAVLNKTIGTMRRRKVKTIV